ncbi:bifunctional phosphopantothenoylcysteine decarboxylase/phosphopantothenate--cysteine ligase CoaBC [Devosia sp.]|uniref:bifunctional phosphopantothenoylcysteine decarboxylase/phosphopantothenate--cysteine ligase CoaBC n=1 Tax=Devosia sp. TaxID=1871048 RepID=UPI002F08E070
MLAGKRILLVVTGGVAAYKALELIRLIQKAGGSVQAVLTRAATQFVTPLAVSTLSGREALTELFDLTQEARIGHIELSRSADLIVVAPATADFLARLAHGIADDLASTCLLATDTGILVAPAMNVRMWQAAATQRNLATLRADGVSFVGPDEGEMACGEYGPGRMAEPEAILAAIAAHFAAAAPGPLAGRRIVITSGPTREPLDPVRYISNASSGKQGVAIAEALARRGAEVVFVTGPAEAARPAGCAVVNVTTALEMRDAVLAALPADAAICVAAVADWRAAHPAAGKMKKQAGAPPPALELVANPDILAEVAQLPAGRRPALVVGFAAETDAVLDNARAKLARKGCDWLLANDVGGGAVFGADDTQVVLLARDGGSEDWGRQSKAGVGDRLADRIAGQFARK